MKLKEYKTMLADCPLCTPKNSWNLTQWNSQNSDDFKIFRVATLHDTATEHEVQKYDPKLSLISYFR